MKVTNLDQKFSIKAISQKTGYSENDVITILIELGMMFAVAIENPDKNYKNLFPLIVNTVDKSPEKKICKAIYEVWKLGAES